MDFVLVVDRDYFEIRSINYCLQVETILIVKVVVGMDY